jgi:hypothetical protein
LLPYSCCSQNNKQALGIDFGSRAVDASVDGVKTTFVAHAGKKSLRTQALRR